MAADRGEMGGEGRRRDEYRTFVQTVSKFSDQNKNSWLLVASCPRSMCYVVDGVFPVQQMFGQGLGRNNSRSPALQSKHANLLFSTDKQPKHPKIYERKEMVLDSRCSRQCPSLEQDARHHCLQVTSHSLGTCYAHITSCFRPPLQINICRLLAEVGTEQAKAWPITLAITCRTQKASTGSWACKQI